MLLLCDSSNCAWLASRVGKYFLVCTGAHVMRPYLRKLNAQLVVIASLIAATTISAGKLNTLEGIVPASVLP